MSDKLTIVPANELESRVLLTVAETAGTFFGTTAATLFKRMERGQAPTTVRIGKRRYFRKSDVERWIDAHTQFRA